MKTKTIRQLFLYNYRFLFAYLCIAVFGLFFLGWQLWSLPPGLADSELTTAARHTTLSSILSLPIHPLHSLMQWLSMTLLDANTLSIRLPSAIISALTVLTIYNLLKRWFGKSAALLTATLLVSADWFLFIGRLGVGSIEFTLWLSLALLSLTKLLSHQKKWFIPFSLSLSLLLFSPYGIYAAITLIASLLGFIVFRSRFKDLDIGLKIAGTTIFGLFLIAFIVSAFTSADFIKNIFGIDTGLPSALDYLKNVLINTSASVALLPDNNPVIGPTGLFYIRFFEFVFILFGLFMLWRTRVNRLNLIVIILCIVLSLASGISSDSRAAGLLILPAIIFITAGVRHFVHRWQRTFPKNPYARVTAFATMSLLFVVVTMSHYQMYFNLWPSETATRVAFSKKYKLLEGELNNLSGKCIIVNAPENIEQLARNINSTKCQQIFVEQTPAQISADEQIIVAARRPLNYQPANSTIKPLVDERLNDSLHWWVIKPIELPVSDIIEVD